MRKWHKIVLFFTSSMTRYLVLGTWILNSFGTSGENYENVLAKICKGIVSSKTICKGIFFMLFQGSIFEIYNLGRTPLSKSNQVLPPGSIVN